MARNLSRAQPPSLERADFALVMAEGAAHGDHTWDQMPLEALRGPDGRYDFPHFWLFPAFAAPLVALAALFGLHPAVAFTVLNVVLVVGVSFLLVRTGANFVAVLVAAILLWWVDKAHAEIFITTVTGAALLLRERAPRASLILLGIGAAQMPLLLPLLAICAVTVLARHQRRAVVAVVASCALAALSPAYYLWRLDLTSPLVETLLPHVPPLRALLTPLVDPNVGIVWFVPVLAGLTTVGLIAAAREQAWLELGILAVGCAAILVAGTQTPNVNHGGTPGMSRYGVWLLGIVLPLVVRGDAWAAARRHRTYTMAVVLSVLFAAYVLHPRLGDAGTRPSPTRLATLVWTQAPALDNPLPEVFAERVGHVDGPAPVPVATAGCEKALIVGTGTGVLWPATCHPRPARAECASAGALCYANGSSVVMAPRQPGFSPPVADAGIYTPR